MNTIRAMLETIKHYAQNASGEENPEINLKVCLNSGQFIYTHYDNVSLTDDFVQIVDMSANIITIKYEFVAAIQTA